MQALILNASSKTASVQSRPIPKPNPGELLIKVHAIALNPVDAIYVFKPLGASGRTVGTDFAGVVVSSGSGSTDGQLQPGQKVAGFLQGACSVNDRPGAFTEYLTCPADLVWRVPDSVPLGAAASVSLCALTAAQALFYRLGLKAPFDWGASTDRNQGTVSDTVSTRYFFIYGASTSVGMYAAQLLRRSAEVSREPIKLIGAASKARFSMLQAEPYGFDALVDYREEDWPEQIRKLTGGAGADWAYDCISEGSTVRRVSITLRKNGKVAVVRSKAYGAWDPSGLPEDVETVYGAVWEGLGEEVHYNQFVIPASPETRAFAVAFYGWLSGGEQIKANPIRLMPGGLERVVPDGLALLGSGSMEDRAKGRDEPWMKPVSAEKLVYKLDA